MGSTAGEIAAARWLQVIVSEEMLIKVIEEWFAAVKDLLDDGKVNGSRKN